MRIETQRLVLFARLDWDVSLGSDQVLTAEYLTGI